MTTQAKTMYAAQFSQWGTPTLAEVQAIETTKSWRIVNQDYLKATIFRSVIRKEHDDVQMFESKQEAAQYLVDENAKWLTQQLQRIEKAERLMGPIRQIVNAE